jgi:phage terminase large subunit-like protein
VPDGEEHPDLFAALQLVREAGIELDEWQERIFRGSLLRKDGRWAAFAVGVCCPRQNGKNALLEAVELAALFVLGERLIIHSAHQADTAKEAFRRLADVVESRPWLESEVAHIRYTNGHEAIELKSGQRIRFRTRTGKSGRGFSGDRVIFDEAMYLAEASMGSLLPTISAQPDPQIWYTGSAVDQYVHEDGVVFARVRDRALSGDDPRLYYAEWSVDADTPDDVDDEMANDLRAVAAANPALGIRIAPEYVDAERRELDGARSRSSVSAPVTGRRPTRPLSR